MLFTPRNITVNFTERGCSCHREGHPSGNQTGPRMPVTSIRGKHDPWPSRLCRVVGVVANDIYSATHQTRGLPQHDSLEQS